MILFRRDGVVHIFWQQDSPVGFLIQLKRCLAGKFPHLTHLVQRQKTLIYSCFVFLHHSLDYCLLRLCLDFVYLQSKHIVHSSIHIYCFAFVVQHFWLLLSPLDCRPVFVILLCFVLHTINKHSFFTAFCLLYYLFFYFFYCYLLLILYSRLFDANYGYKNSRENNKTGYTSSCAIDLLCVAKVPTKKL